MKYRLFLGFAVVVIVAFGGFLYAAWPYRGLVPTLVPPPIDLGEATPTTSSSTNDVGEMQPGKNETGLPLKLPEGFSMSVFAKNTPGARVVLDVGDALIVSLTTAGKIVRLVDADKNGIAERVEELARGLNKPHGLALRTTGNLRFVYVAELQQLSRYELSAEGKLMNKTKLTSLPSGGRHFTRTILRKDVPSESDIYLSIGSSCDVCNEKDARHGTVQIWNGSEMKPYAQGLRNAVFMTYGPDGKIWVTEMGRDFLGDELPPDEINVLEAEKNYGWPTCYGQNIHDTQFDKNTYIRNPCMEPFEMPSKIDLPAHSAPLGLAFIPADKGWPKEYEGNLLVAFHGSWNRSEPTGYKVRRFVLDANGNVVKDEDFISGWLDDAAVLGRPVDLKFDNNGTLFISDDRAGLVYRVTAPKR
jgi:glucose/arabinose dehydrogenase